MYAVCVTFELESGAQDAFLRLMHANAQTSLQVEAGCSQFDVLTDPTKSNAVFLYELYTDRAAFDVHLTSDHFVKFDSAVADMVAHKDIKTWVEVAQ